VSVSLLDDNMRSDGTEDAWTGRTSNAMRYIVSFFFTKEFVQLLKKIGYQYKFGAVQHETRNIGSGVKLVQKNRSARWSTNVQRRATSLGAWNDTENVARKEWPGRATGLWEFFPEVAHLP
jgi:hypothetical protein